MDVQSMREKVLEAASGALGEKVTSVDAEIMQFLLANAEITVNEGDDFIFRVNCGGVMQSAIDLRLAKIYEGTNEEDEIYHHGRVRRAYSGWYDFGHCTPDWKNVVTLGIGGLKARLENEAERNANAYYPAGVKTLSAVQEFMLRVADKFVAAGNVRTAERMRFLAFNAPQTTYDVLIMLPAFYTLVQFVEGTSIRSLGRMDTLLEPFYVSDIENGMMTRAEAKKMIGKFISEIDDLKIGSNLPFAVGGRRSDGSLAASEVSKVLLEEYAALSPANVKIHFLYTEQDDLSLTDIALKSIRNGGNSIVFMNDDIVRVSLEKLGFDNEDATEYSVIGCYEPSAAGEMPCSCNARVNLPKVIEAVINGGNDLETDLPIGLTDMDAPRSYAQFMQNFYAQLDYFARAAMDVTDEKEVLYPLLHSSPLFSSSMDTCVKNGSDVYADYGAKYNSSSVNLQGTANAADAIYAIKKLVYEDETLTLDELKTVLKNNWAGHEKLRLTVKNKFPHYGNNAVEVDRIAADIVSAAARTVNGKPNKKGGCYRLGTFSVDWRFEFGKFTAASADGRLSGEPLSKNTGASFGFDKQGVTAHMLSTCVIDSSDTPNGSVVDIVLHSSATRGEDGLNALKATLTAFCKKGGMAVHYNVLDPKTLRAAQKDPELYPNLQVRLCGWNVLFSSLNKYEQDEFIAKAEEHTH